jgi:hypothetical protein
MNTTTEKLTEQLNAFYETEKLEPSCALEALHNPDLTEAQRDWLEDFNHRWEASQTFEGLGFEIWNTGGGVMCWCKVVNGYLIAAGEEESQFGFHCYGMSVTSPNGDHMEAMERSNRDSSELYMLLRAAIRTLETEKPEEN